jgi:hypothetical protein
MGWDLTPLLVRATAPRRPSSLALRAGSASLPAWKKRVTPAMGPATLLRRVFGTSLAWRAHFLSNAR